MDGIPVIQSKLPATGVSIFSVMSRLAEDHGAINLSQGFPDFDCAPQLVEAVARYMREGNNQYAPMQGVFVLREALSRKIELLYGRRYDPATEITVTSGATEGLFSTLTALVRPGDEVVLLQPAYDSYGPVVQLSGGIPVFVTLRGPDYRVDWDDVRRAVTSRTRIIVVNSPHNPTGMLLDRDDMRELGAVLQGCYRCAGDDQWIVVTAPDDRALDALGTVTGRPGSRSAAEAHEALASWALTRRPWDAFRELQEAGIAAGVVSQGPDLTEMDEHLRAREAIAQVPHPELGEIPTAQCPIVLDGKRLEVRFSADALSGHTEQVLCEELGMSQVAYRAFAEEGVV